MTEMLDCAFDVEVLGETVASQCTKHPGSMEPTSWGLQFKGPNLNLNIPGLSLNSKRLLETKAVVG